MSRLSQYATPKKLNLDEKLDEVFSRPIARPLARVLHHFGVTPDQVTYLSMFLGLGAGFSMASDGLWPVVGSCMLLAMIVLDCADGELARLRPPSSNPWWGRTLDGMADMVTGFAVHIGMCVHLCHLGISVGGYQLSDFTIFLICLSAGVSLAWSAGVVDDVKQRLKPDSVDHDLDRYAEQPRTFMEKFFFKFQQNYVKNIARYSGPGRPGGYEHFRRVQWMGLTHRLFGAAVAGLLVPFFPTAFLTFSIIAAVPANLLLVGMLWWGRREARAAEAEASARRLL